MTKDKRDLLISELETWAEACECTQPGDALDAAKELERLGEASPEDIRALGWAVEQHYDSLVNGSIRAVWRFSRGISCVEAEGENDADALNVIRGLIETKDYNAD